eukprot:15478977-Alexandrium_andersonii.AAC.1
MGSCGQAYFENTSAGLTDDELASTLVPEAPGGCALRRCSRRLRICQRTRGPTGSAIATSTTSQTR